LLGVIAARARASCDVLAGLLQHQITFLRTQETPTKRCFIGVREKNLKPREIFSCVRHGFPIQVATGTKAWRRKARNQSKRWEVAKL